MLKYIHKLIEYAFSKNERELLKIFVYNSLRHKYKIKGLEKLFNNNINDIVANNIINANSVDEKQFKQCSAKIIKKVQRQF